jgi:hypothetical protein
MPTLWGPNALSRPHGDLGLGRSHPTSRFQAVSTVPQTACRSDFRPARPAGEEEALEAATAWLADLCANWTWLKEAGLTVGFDSDDPDADYTEVWDVFDVVASRRVPSEFLIRRVREAPVTGQPQRNAQPSAASGRHWRPGRALASGAPVEDPVPTPSAGSTSSLRLWRPPGRPGFV